MFIEYSIVVGALLFALYKWSTWDYKIFEERGIPFSKPFPLFGNMGGLLLRQTSMFDLIASYYEKFNCKMFGIFDQRRPLFVIKDPLLVRQITVKDFDHFVNHRPTFPEEHNTDESNLFASSLIQMKNAQWKDMRSTLSPAFTGSKMRQMYELINKVAQETMEHLKLLPDINKGVELDVKDYTTRFTNDVIASTAFGLNVNSFKDKNNEFYTMGKKVTTFTAWQNLKFLLYANFKPIMKLFKIEVFDVISTNYFRHLVLDAMKYRQEHKIVRPDMINMLMEARGLIDSEHPKLREWTDTEIVGQCFLFFFAGFEVASVLSCFAAHELMENPEIQEKLYEEILEVTENSKTENVSYESIQAMKYLDMVVSEALRKWPPAVAMDRICNKDFVYEADGERIELKKGDAIWIPSCGFHRDPKYFPNPLKFDPERFSEENRDKLVPFTYMPFGLGPRNCIASRFAQLEVKSLLFYLVRDFKITAAKKSSIPIKLSKAGFQLLPENGFWLKLTCRTSNKT